MNLVVGSRLDLDDSDGIDDYEISCSRVKIQPANKQQTRKNEQTLI